MHNHSSFILTIIFLTIMVLAVAQFVVTNNLSTSGVELSKLRGETLFFKQENGVLKTELTRTLSMASISARATAAGFVRDNQPLVLTSGQSFALR